MGKIAIVTDSNSGITQEESTLSEGLFVLPMPVLIDEETYFEGIDLSQEQFYEKLLNNCDVSTSQPSPESVLNLWDELLIEYDSIVHIPMSSGLSGSCETAIMLSQDYDGKVQVVNNQRISITQRRSVYDAIMLREAGKSAAQIKEILETDKMNSSIYIMVDTLYFLKKGGRVTPAAAALGTLLKIKPVLQIHGEKLDAYAKARTITLAKQIMINAITKDMNEEFGGNSPDNMYFDIAYTKDIAPALEFKEELLKLYPGYDIIVHPLSLSVSCHIGPGALAVGCSRKIRL